MSLSNAHPLLSVALFWRCFRSYVWQWLSCDLVSGIFCSTATHDRTKFLNVCVILHRSTQHWNSLPTLVTISHTTNKDLLSYYYQWLV